MAKTRKIPLAYKIFIIALALNGILFIYMYLPRYVSVETVLNGDTLLLENGIVVKLIGVDVPEANYSEERVRHFGLAAADLIQGMVEGKKVRIEYHQQQDNMDGRALASVYLMDGTFLNSEIIKQGYGRADSECTSKYVEKFQEYEQQARENKRRFWAEIPGYQDYKKEKADNLKGGGQTGYRHFITS